MMTTDPVALAGKMENVRDRLVRQRRALREMVTQDMVPNYCVDEALAAVKEAAKFRKHRSYQWRLRPVVEEVLDLVAAARVINAAVRPLRPLLRPEFSRGGASGFQRELEESW